MCHDEHLPEVRQWAAFIDGCQALEQDIIHDGGDEVEFELVEVLDRAVTKTTKPFALDGDPAFLAAFIHVAICCPPDLYADTTYY